MMFRKVLYLTMSVLWLSLISTESNGQDVVPSPATLLDAVEQPSPGDKWAAAGFDEGTPAFEDARAAGVRIIPELVKRMEACHSVPILLKYKYLMCYITAITPYYYTTVHCTYIGVDLFEPEVSRLPFLKRDFNEEPPDLLQERDAYVAWWKQIQEDNTYTTRFAAVAAISKRLSPDGKNMTGTDYRAYWRVTANYGIFNIPIFITLIRKGNSPLAFMEFLRTVRFPEYQCLGTSIYPEERLKQVADKWPSYEERVKVVETWWSESSTKYEEAIPALAHAIAKAMKE